jgi:hypothetical protein
MPLKELNPSLEHSDRKLQRTPGWSTADMDFNVAFTLAVCTLAETTDTPPGF